MQTITLKVEDKVYEKFTWLLNHFEKNEIEIINETNQISDKLLDIEPLKNNSADYVNLQNIKSQNNKKYSLNEAQKILKL